MNIGGNIIRRIIVHNSIYHCLIQDACGHIHHVKFDNKAAAYKYMTRFNPTTIKVEYL